MGLLDESLGYGYDNDLSYRLSAAGHRLVIRREAASVHRWREGLTGYLSQHTASATAASTWSRDIARALAATPSRPR